MGYRARVKSGRSGKTYIRYFVKKENYDRAIAKGAKPITKGESKGKGPVKKIPISGKGPQKKKGTKASVGASKLLKNSKPGKTFGARLGSRVSKKTKAVRADQKSAVLKEGKRQMDARAERVQTTEAGKETQRKIRELKSKMRTAQSQLRQMKKAGRRITSQISLVQQYLGYKKELKKLKEKSNGSN